MLTSCSNNDTRESLKINTAHRKDEYKLFSKKHLMVYAKRGQHQSSSKMAKLPSDLDNQDHCYYNGGSSVSIPFTWELQPGTPKVVKFRESSLPPLTPPPSYFNSPVTKRPSQSTKYTTTTKKPSFVRAIIFPKKKQLSRSLSTSSSCSTSRSSTYFSPAQSPPSKPSKVSGQCRVVSSPRKVSVDSRVVRGGRDEDEEHGSPVSTLCFGRISANSRSRPGCYSSLVKVLLS